MVAGQTRRAAAASRVWRIERRRSRILATTSASTHTTGRGATRAAPAESSRNCSSSSPSDGPHQPPSLLRRPPPSTSPNLHVVLEPIFLSRPLSFSRSLSPHELDRSLSYNRKRAGQRTHSFFRPFAIWIFCPSLLCTVAVATRLPSPRRMAATTTTLSRPATGGSLLLPMFVSVRKRCGPHHAALAGRRQLA